MSIAARVTNSSALFHEALDGGRTRAAALALVVLEEDVGLFPLLRRHALRPFAECGLVVIELVESQISPRRGAHHRAPEVILLGDAHRYVPLAHRVIDLVVEPALVPKLEHVTPIRWQQS